MEESGGHVLLGKASFEAIGNGRVRCVETGHEMPEEQALSYSTSKKCQESLFNVALALGKPPLNFFHQSPQARSMVVCKLTGALVKKNEDSIWKHVMGKKFQKKLEAKTIIPNMATNALECTSSGGAREPDEKACLEEIAEIDCKFKGTKDLTEKTNVKIGTNASCVDDSLNQDEEPDFWTPPVGAWWDFDCGGDRWAASGNQKATSKNELSRGCLAQIANEDNEGVENGAEVHSKDTCQSDSDYDVIRMKRLSLSKSSSKSAHLRKKRKANC